MTRNSAPPCSTTPKRSRSGWRQRQERDREHDVCQTHDPESTRRRSSRRASRGTAPITTSISTAKIATVSEIGRPRSIAPAGRGRSRRRRGGARDARSERIAAVQWTWSISWGPGAQECPKIARSAMKMQETTPPARAKYASESGARRYCSKPESLAVARAKRVAGSAFISYTSPEDRAMRDHTSASRLKSTTRDEIRTHVPHQHRKVELAERVDEQLPIPGHAKIVSITTAPPTSAGS